MGGDPGRLPSIGGRVVAVADAGGVGEQITDGDRPLRRDDIMVSMVELYDRFGVSVGG